jgi:hypothetical protein
MINLSYEGSPKGLLEYIGREICEHCFGEGVLYFMERDRDGHFADTGMKTCYCRIQDRDRSDE